MVILAVTWFFLVPRLPDVNSLRDYHLQTPLRVMSRDGKLISEFGEQRRIPLSIDQVPQLYIDALLSAEDENFYSHYGVDPKALLRAAVRMVQAGGKIQGGGSTITMQVARNYLLTLDQTFIRKFNEILLSFQIEQELSKKQILEMYFNKMFMGHRAYGIEAASHVYYGRSISELDLPQLAMLAGLYKAPSKYNPISNPTRSKIRRDWILGRMLKLNYIQQEQFEVAIETPITARFHSLKPETSASYVAEMVRSELFDAFPIEDVYTGGYRVYTTIDSKLQDAAQLAVQTGLLAYDRRHGYRGVEKNHGPNVNVEDAEKLLNRTPVFGPLQPAIVRRVDEESAQLLLRYGQIITINFSDMSWVRPRLSINSLGRAPDNISQILRPGDQVRVRQAEDVSFINPKTGKEIIIKDVIADAMLQQILLRPAEYSVIATLNLNGDYLSDALAAQVGGIGIAPGANMNDDIAIFEATHGTAPKYAGLNKVNPGSVILSAEMMLRHMGWVEAADLLLKGMSGAINAKSVTYDFERLMDGATLVTCSEFGDCIIDHM